MTTDNPKKIKVLVVAPSMRVMGGQSIQARRLLDAFDGDDAIEAGFTANDPETIFQNIPGLRTIFTSLRFWWSLFRAIPRYDVIHIFSSGTTSYLISTLPPLYIARAFGKKTILNYHTGEAREHLKNWKRTAVPTMKKFDRIVVPSGFLVDVFGRFDLKAEAIANFIDTDAYVFRERSPLEPVFLSNRNFEKHYQVGDILGAFQIIQRSVPEAQLIVAGSGSEEQGLKNLATELGLKNIEFTGRVEQSEMPTLYDRAGIYLNSSIVDNMPLSILEAFASGLPVVTTNPGGITYMVKNERTGLLVEVGDYEGLAKAALRLLRDEDLAQSIIETARLECEKYGAEKLKGEWRELYRGASQYPER